MTASENSRNISRYKAHEHSFKIINVSQFFLDSLKLDKLEMQTNKALQPCPDWISLLVLPLVHFQAAGIQQTVLQHLYQDLHVCAVFAGFPAVASLEAAVHRLPEASTRCICKSLTR